jgi:hypothetical protein
MRRKKTAVTGSVRRPESLHGTAKQRFWSCGLRKVPFDRIAEALGMTKGAANKAFTELCDASPKLSRTKFARKSLSLDSYKGSTLVDNRQACKPLGPRLRKSPSTAQHVLN